MANWNPIKKKKADWNKSGWEQARENEVASLPWTHILNELTRERWDFSANVENGSQLYTAAVVFRNSIQHAYRTRLANIYIISTFFFFFLPEFICHPNDWSEKHLNILCKLQILPQHLISYNWINCLIFMKAYNSYS